MKTTQLFSHSESSIFDYSNTSVLSTECFTTEAQLVDLFNGIVDHKIDQNSSGLISEFVCGDGIADTVFYELTKNWKNAIILGEIPPRWVYALYKLPLNKGFTTEDFIARTTTTRNTALRILNQYTDLQFCEKVGKSDKWIKTNQPVQLVNHIYAVEAKLRHWKRALSQAIRYRDYAIQSWVLLDEYNVSPAINNINQFQRLNIGLAALSTTGSIKSYFIPKALTPKSDLRFWQANSEIARRLISGF